MAKNKTTKKATIKIAGRKPRKQFGSTYSTGTAKSLARGATPVEKKQ